MHGLRTADGHPDYPAVARQGDVIADSVLSKNYAWPTRDPTTQPHIPERVLDDELTGIIRQAARTTHFSWDGFWSDHRHLSVVEQVLELLNHRGFQFNSRRLFRNHTSLWPDRIAAA